jgi:zinc transporter ZupT
VLIGALSFHSVFDGLAIGTATTGVQLTAVSVAVFAHKVW